MERLRWRIASLVEKLLPGQCWPKLVDWVLFDANDRRFGARRGLPFGRIDETCRKDAERVGCCYCGKLRRPDVHRGRGVVLAVAAVLAASSCADVQPALTVQVSGDAPRATLLLTVGRETDSKTVSLPYEHRYRARLVVVQAVVAVGRVACLIRHGEEPVGTDTDGRPNVAACSASVPEDPR